MSAACTASSSCPTRRRTGAEAKALRNAASKALAGEIEARADAVRRRRRTRPLVLVQRRRDALAGRPGRRKLEPGDKLLRAAPAHRWPTSSSPGGARDKVEARLEAWLKAHVVRLLGPLAEARDIAGAHGHRPRHRLPDRRGARRARALARSLTRSAALDQEAAAALAQARRPLRRLPPLSAGAAEARAAAPRGAALGAASTAGSTRRASTTSLHLAHRAAPRSRSTRRLPQGPLSRRRLPRLRRARGARRHPRAAGRPDPPGDPLPPRPHPRASRRRRRRRRRLHRDVAMTSLVGCAGEDFASILRSLG